MSKDDDEENTSILNKIEDLLFEPLNCWIAFLIILGYLFYYFKHKKIFSRGLFKWLFILFFIMYVVLIMITIFIVMLGIEMAGG